MAKHSPARAGWPVLSELELISRGKVRDTYRLSIASDRLLVVATDGISIFDFVLNALVPMKGVILNAMNHFWLKYLAGFGFETHFVAAGANIDTYLPEELRGNADLQARAMVVRELKIAPVEFVFRNCLTGSGLKNYDKTGRVNGHVLANGLQDGDQLPYILDDPTTKEEEGHDEHADALEVRTEYPGMTYNLLRVFQIARDYAGAHGIMLADTKFEGSKDVLGDEVLTPDSSRFWDINEWCESRKPAEDRKAPTSLDKQLVREWGKSMGVDKLDPEKPEDVEAVHAMTVPPEIIAQTTQTYRYIFWRLTGRTIEQYLRDVMKVRIPLTPMKNVLVICGSETDLPQVKAVCADAKLTATKVTIHVMSCHRNPQDLTDFIIHGLEVFDVVIGVGSKALALPGIIDAWGHFLKKNVRVAGVALGEPGSRALLAAQLSIEELPGQPVIINEMTDHAYTGPAGLRELLKRIDEGELPPEKPRKEKRQRSL